jgi:hypothetical protein
VEAGSSLLVFCVAKQKLEVKRLPPTKINAPRQIRYGAVKSPSPSIKKLATPLPHALSQSDQVDGYPHGPNKMLGEGDGRLPG